MVRKRTLVLPRAQPVNECDGARNEPRSIREPGVQGL